MGIVITERSMRTICFFILILIMVSGCSLRKSSARADQIEVEDKEQAKKILNTDQVICKGKCPEYVGAFYLYHSPVVSGNIKTHQVRLCSVTLIEKNKILTNRHCIEGVLKQGDVCTSDTYIEIKFPQTATHAFASYKCKKIDKTSGEYFMPGTKKQRHYAPDWAIVELESDVVGRTPVKMVSGSLSEKTDVSLYPVFFDKSFSPAKGVIKSVNCVQSFLEPKSLMDTDADAPLFSMGQCNEKLIHGNSGSGVFLRDQPFLMGVMATTDLEGQKASGTQAHCLPPMSSSSSAEGCLFYDDQQFTDIMKAYSYIRRMMEPGIKSISQDEAIFETSNFKWRQKEFGREDLEDFKFNFNSPWSDYISYLQGKGHRRMTAKFKIAMGRLFLLRVPECVQPKAVTQGVSMVMGDLENWKFLSEFVWQEMPQDNGAEGTKTVFSFPNNRLFTVRPTFQVSGSGVVNLESEDVLLPKAIRRLQMRLPICKE